MLIGVSGKAGSGKGEFAKIAKEKFGAEIISFATGVKEEVAEFYTKYEVAYNPCNLYGTPYEKETPLRIRYGQYPEFFEEIFGPHCEYNEGWLTFSTRTIMQLWGTEYRRSQDDNYWVKKAMAKITNPKQLYVIDDVRFPNETTAILSVHGNLIRVYRPQGVTISNMAHPSEIALDGWKEWNCEILNAGTLEHYHEQCRDVLSILEV